MYQTARYATPVPADAVAGATLTNLTAVIGRIEETVEAETSAIRTDIGFDIEESNARKSRYLHELNRAVGALGGKPLPAEQRDMVLRLRAKLAANEAAILAHLNAVSEVAGIIQQSIQSAETDGTYSESAFARAYAP